MLLHWLVVELKNDNSFNERIGNRHVQRWFIGNENKKERKGT